MERRSEAEREVTKLQVEVILSLKESFKATQTTFKVNFYINIVIVALGVVLMLIAVIQSISRGIDPLSVTFGGLGVANFVAVFWLNPQDKLQDNLCKLSQINIVLANFLYEYDGTLENLSSSGKTSIKEQAEINKECERIVSFALESIRKFVLPQKQT